MPPPVAGAPGVVENWFRDRLLHFFKDDFGRSARRHGLPRPVSGPDLPGFGAKLALLRKLRTDHPGFFEAHDYSWAFERESYVDPGGSTPEAADQNVRHQLTVLRTLVGTWEIVQNTMAGVPLDFSGICAREVNSSGLSPTCRLSGGFGYLMLPFGFRRLTRELLHAFCKTAQIGESDGPGCFSLLSRPLPRQAFAAFPLPFAARRLGIARSDDMANQYGAEEFLLAEVEPFAGACLDLRAASAGGLEAGLHELLLVFAVNHELGHVLYRHCGGKHASDEGVADTTSLDVSLQDWGWLARSGQATGLPDPVWMLLSPHLFFWTVEIVLRLDVLLDGGVSEETAGRFRVLAERRARVDERIAWLVRDVWPRFGVAAPDEALRSLSGFRANLDLAAASFDAASGLAEAVRIGKERLGRGLEARRLFPHRNGGGGSRRRR